MTLVWLGQPFETAVARGVATVSGGLGNDVIRLNYRSVVVTTGDGDDSVHLGLAVGSLYSDAEGSVNRQVALGPGNDYARGSKANDRISGGPGDDVIIGGGTYRYLGGLVPTLAPDSLSELLLGDDGGDTLRHFPDAPTSQTDAAVLDGGAGDDALDSASSNAAPMYLWEDDVNGGAGDDSCSGDLSDVLTNC